MAKNKIIKPVTNAKLGSDFELHRKKVGQALYAKGKTIIKKSKEVIKTDARTIIREARQAKESLKKRTPRAALNGIKDLKIDGARLMNFLKDIKVKESPSESKVANQTIIEKPEVVRTEAKQKIVFNDSVSYYDKWYDLINSELNRTTSTK